MPQDPRVEHLQRLHRQRRLRAAGHFSRTGAPGYGDIPQRSLPHDAGRMLLALVLLSIILGALLSLPGHGDVRTWVHQLSYSLQVDRVGMLPPPGGFGLAFLGFFAGDRARARELVAECLSLYHELGHKGGIAMLLESCAIIAAIEGAGEAAARLLGAADALREAINSPRPPSYGPIYDTYVSRLPSDFPAAWRQGQTMPLDESIALAFNIAGAV